MNIDLNNGTYLNFNPKTNTDERLAELMSRNTGIEHKAEWVKQALDKHWSSELPQPFINYDPDTETFIFTWMTLTQCKTLDINTDTGIGLCDTVNMKPKDWEHFWWEVIDDTSMKIDLNNKEAWKFIEDDLLLDLSQYTNGIAD